MFSFRVVVLILGCLWLTEAARDTLNTGDKLSSNSSDNLVSPNGNVTFGFFRQEYHQTWDDKSFGYYLAMWHVDVKQPFHLGVLQESGNLVLQGTNEENGENVVLWQSFDHPTDSFLPGMKLGVSHGRNFSLTSWFNDSIPASWSFTMEWDPTQNRLVVRLRERILWTNGEDFENIGPSDPFNMNYNFTNKYVYYTLVISQYTLEERRKNYRLVLQDDGDLQLGDIYTINLQICDSNSTENGCERWEGPKCQKKGDKYELRTI
ncbi:G-type lectin S-receptor-like protein serine/threonine-protein kinase CES101 [Gossypium australe]|uniref:G-type lectin S-receptor-like protein serine/threonine-protein kinase CES101 n=1 Tax=Gossypium australe TaxID=47621 RepID=A0A5B6WA98_9ROSI|nr:G-type lectin S-receptor-like protein serine/threonine-protein kinase CES101 [Gossypium australe]